MKKFKNRLSIVVQISLLLVLVFGLSFIITQSIISNIVTSKSAGTESYPSPVATNENGKSSSVQEQVQVAYPAPSEEPVPETIIKPAICQFSGPANMSEVSALPLESLTLSEPRIIFQSKKEVGIAGWLPDSEQLLVAQDTENGHQAIGTINAQTGDFTIYATRDGTIKPVWIDELKAVAYTTIVDRHAELWITDGAQNSSVINKSVDSLSFSSDGRRLFFISPDFGKQPQIWDTRTKTAVSGGPDLASFQYSKFSPIVDSIAKTRTLIIRPQPFGSKIVYFNNPWLFLEDQTDKQVCEINLGQIGGIPVSVLNAKWSPNGQYLALITTAKLPEELVTFNSIVILDTITGKQYTPPVEVPIIFDLSWSGNSMYIAILAEIPGRNILQGNLYLFGIKEPDRIIKISDQLFGGGIGDDWQLSWSPDNQRIAIKCSVWQEVEPLVFQDQICIIDTNLK